MIKRITIKNFRSFKGKAVLSFKAEKTDRLLGNLFEKGNSRTYKSLAIFSGNNIGKTSLMEGVRSIKNLLLGNDPTYLFETNIHSKSKVVEMSITFEIARKTHLYLMKFDVDSSSFLEERIDEEVHLGPYKDSYLRNADPAFKEQGNLIEVLMMDELPPIHRLDDLSELLLKGLGLEIEKGHEDLSSLGSRRAAMLTPHVVDALLRGKSLFIDEFDSGLSFSLTRAIVSLFNNIDNDKAQLVFASHDLTLFDTERLFLTPQIKILRRRGSSTSILSLEKLLEEGEDPKSAFMRGHLGGVNRTLLSRFLVELNRRKDEA